MAIDSTRIKAKPRRTGCAATAMRGKCGSGGSRWRQEDPDQEPGLEVEAETAQRLRQEMRGKK